MGALAPGETTTIGGQKGTTNAFRSQNARVHFRVKSSQSAYWRTGAYVRYTGDAWERPDDGRPWAGQREVSGPAGERISYEVTLERSATALPTAWRPTTVEGVDGTNITGRRAVRSETVLPAGTTYRGVSLSPAADPSVLRTSDQNYPESIARRYTRLPDDTPARVGAFTDNLTADADSPYETAVAIEQWLESEKTYDLNASHEGDHVADSFIFEMERGYCQYFATSMVVMLRSEGVPARYVVGYSTGRRVAENTYAVRGMNAHAWVEVYFEDVGWVKFDPTPGGSRLAREQQSLQAAGEETGYQPAESGSPGEVQTPSGEPTATPTTTPTATPTATPTSTDDTPTPDGTTPTPDDEDATSNETTNTTSPADYDVSLDRQPVPGATVEVTVTRDGDPVAGAVVLFNGRAVDVTADDGTASGRVPYAEELRIRIAEDGGDAASLTVSGGAGPVLSGRLASLPPPGNPVAVGSPPGPANVTYPLETNATVEVAGRARPGETVLVSATINGVAVPDAQVTVDGEPVARTDDNGRATVRLPDRSGDVRIGVSRDPVSGETVVTVPELSVAVDPDLPLSLPATGATVTVSADGEPVADAAVTVDGQRVATTGPDGTAHVGLPLANRAEIRAASDGLAARRTVDGLLVNLGLSLVAVGLLLGGVAALFRRYDGGLRDLLAGLRRLPTWVATSGTALLVALAAAADEAIADCAARLRRVIGRLRRGETTLAELGEALVAGLRERLVRRDADFGAATGDRPDDGSPRSTVRAAWRRFLSLVSVRQPATKSPGELAAHAVDEDDLPGEAVETLRDAYRDVEYGTRSAADRLQAVRSALDALESTADETEDDS